MAKDKIITVQGRQISFQTFGEEDYISLTDITTGFPDGKFLVPRWLRNRDTLEFLGVWEKLNNPDFRVIEFDNLYAESGHNRFSMSVSRWMETTGAIGFQLRKGKGANTYAISLTETPTRFPSSSWENKAIKTNNTSLCNRATSPGEM